MLFDIDTLPGGISVVQLRGSLNKASLHGPLMQLAERLTSAHSSAIIFDMARVKRVNMAGIAALIDVFKSRHDLRIGASGLPEKLIKTLAQTGLATLFNTFDSVEQALAAPEMRKLSLSRTRAVVLCAGSGQRARPLSDDMPVPMLDIVGQPLLDHVLDHLERSGITDVILNPGHLGPMITNHYAVAPRRRQSLFFVNEGRFNNGVWTAAPLGSVSTLKRLQTAHSAISDDVIVMSGTTMTQIDLPAMMDHHRSKNADLTVAIQPNCVSSTTAPESQNLTPDLTSNPRESGTYILSPRVLDMVGEQVGLDIIDDLIPLVLAADGIVTEFADTSKSLTIQCARDYAIATTIALKTNSYQKGVQIAPHQWAHETAQVSPKAQLVGPVYVAAGARVDAQARIVGPSVIGAGSHINAKTLTRASIVMPNTRVSSGAILDHVITSAEWTVDHRYADGSRRPTDLVDCVGPIVETRSRLATAV